MYEEYLAFGIDIAYKAGELMLKYFTDDSKESYKIDNTIVTLADKEINDYLIKRVRETYPDHAVEGEEASFGKSKMLWVCDPIDGTAVYARRIPVAVFSLALVVEGEPHVGIVYDPFTASLYTAVKGKGAYLNGQSIKVNDTAIGDMKSISNFDTWPQADYDISDLIKELSARTYMISLGSVVRACVAVAAGQFNFSIFPGTKGKNCDTAAIKVIVEEAGGRVTSIFGEEQRYDQDIEGALVSNALVHDELLDLIKANVKRKN